jgi:lipopolysaccharide transport system ATP-binding protein
MIVIKAENVGKKFDLGLIGSGSLRETLTRARHRMSLIKKANEQEFWALRNVSFELEQGGVLGIIGRNGAGKSTLLKVLSRITPPTTGKIEVRGRLASLLEVGTGFHPELTGKENIFLNGSILGMKRKEIKSKLDQIIDFSGVEKFLDTPVKRYSSGMYVRLAFAVAAHLEPEILIIDEVLAVGDHEFQAKCLGKMNEVAESGRTVIFVSHNMAAIKNLCNEALLLDNGQIIKRGEAGKMVETYLHQKRHNVKSYDTGYIKSVSIRQDNDEIMLEAEYDITGNYFWPVLGFVVHRDDGEPLFAHSPRISKDSKTYKSGQYPERGRIRAVIKEPKLMDASYSVSVFFGNGYEDYFVDRNCMSFEVAGMTKNYQKPPARVGHIAPECKYTYSAL